MRNFVTLALCAAAFCLLSCSGTPTSSSPKPAAPPSDSRATDASKAAREGNLAPLVGRVWRVSAAPYGPASGSIYIFLPNGTLLETSLRRNVSHRDMVCGSGRAEQPAGYRRPAARVQRNAWRG